MIENEFAAMLQRKYPELSRRTVKELFLLGFFDHRTCLIVLVKCKVDTMCRNGKGKVQAIQDVADEYSMSYETARGYVYGYKDIKIF